MDRTEPASRVGRDADAPSDGWRARLRVALLRRKRLFIALAVAVLASVGVRATLSGASGASLEDALAEVALRDGVRVQTDTVVWLDEDDGPLRFVGALFLARREGELADVYYADVRPGGEHTALDVAWISNLSRTASAEEDALIRSGDSVAYIARVGERVDSFTVIDIRGEPSELTEGWPLRARLQNRVSNLQRTGRVAGFGVRRYQLVEEPSAVTLHASANGFAVDVDGESIAIDRARALPTQGAERVEIQEQEKGMPDNVPWLVDTVRNVSWVGPEPIAWLENRVFGVKDRLTQIYHDIFGAPDTAEEVAEELAVPETVSEERIALLTVTDPELGWPPAPLEPVIDDPVVEGEGRWIPVVDDPFVNAYPNAPPAFFQTFIRTDPERTYTRVYVTIWDPRQVQLRAQSGLREPESATGQRGSGMVPRDPTTMRRLVAAFNGGFQSLHGEFGMMAEGRVYLPPKPWAATVTVHRDGAVGMGSWPAPNWNGRYYDERLANRQIPEDVVDLRQNLTSVVEDRVYNPWERWYWGAAPRDADEQTMTTRSALCLTEEGFLAYYWSQGVGPDALGRAMIQTRCARSIHLDMNSSHCGFEFFRPIAPGETVEPLGRVRRASEYDGRFMRAPRQWRLRARRGVRSMGMPFPRYSDRDARDFFYLTLRPVLPGPEVVVGNEPVAFSTEGLPHAGWPHAFARAALDGGDSEDGESTTWVVRIDPRRAVPGPLRVEEHRRVLGRITAIDRATGSHTIFARRGSVGFELAMGAPEEDDTVIVTGPSLAERADADAAIGVDHDGFLVYLERAGDATPLGARLEALGMTDAIALGEQTRLAFTVAGGHAGPDGYEREAPMEGALELLAEERPAARVLFEDNTPQPYRVWGYLQDQRVRYFPNREGGEGPRFARPPGERDR